MRALQPFRIRVAGTDANHPPACAECGRQPRDDENPADEWRAYLDVDDDLPVFCPECARARVRRGLASSMISRRFE